MTNTASTPTPLGRPVYVRDRIAKMSTEAIVAKHEAALAAVMADQGKSFRGYRFEAQLQRQRSLSLWAAARRDREAGLV